MVLRKLLLFALLGFACTVRAQTVPKYLTQPNSISFTLPYYRPCVSVGIFDAGDHLVRTLLANKPYAAGSHVIHWDGKDDSGIQQPTAPYTAKILSDSIKITFDGVIANTSDSLSGPHHIHAITPISDMVAAGSYIYFCDNFNENAESLSKLDPLHPQAKINIHAVGGGQTINNLCTDNTLVYEAVQNYTGTDNFIAAVQVSNDAEHIFSAGASYSGSYATRTFASVFDKNSSGATGAATGIAVQQAGNYLLVAYGNQNKINVLNKATGAFVRTDLITNPGKIKLENDNTLWVPQGTTCAKYTLNSDGTLTSATLTISGFQRVAAISTYSGSVYIEDGGTNQYIKIYNTTTGLNTGSLLQPGGYVNTSIVSNNRVYIEDLHNKYPAFITHLSDGSLWTADPGDQRTLHFNSSGTYIEQIAYLGRTYSCNVIGNRIFGNFLEYSEDYTQPASSSWTLTHNYGYSLPTTYGGQSVIYTHQPIQAFTLSNGGTYCFISNGLQMFFAELTSTGMTLFPTVLPHAPFMNTDGSITSVALSGTTQIFTRYTITGFSGRQPLLSAGTVVVSYDIGAVYPRTGSSAFWKTSTNKLILLSPNLTTARPNEWHLAGYDLTGNQFLWKTARPTAQTYLGPYPTDNYFDIGNGTNYQAGSMYVNGSIIGYNYHGENWRAGQTNYITLYHENSLMLGVAGTSNAETSFMESPPGMTGNTLILNGVMVGPDLYFWENDESILSGLMRVHVTGLSTVNVQSVIFNYDSRAYTAPAGVIDVMADVPDNTTLPNSGTIQRNPATDNATSPPGSPAFIGKSRIISYKLNESPDIYVRSYGQSASGVVTQNLLKKFPAHATLSNWTVTGEMTLFNCFYSTPGATSSITGSKFHIDLLDINNKVLGTFLCTNASNGTLLFNDQVIATNCVTTLALAARPVKFSITKSGSSLLLVLSGNGVSAISRTVSIYDGTADVTNPGSFGLIFQHSVSPFGAQFGVNKVKLQYQ